MILVNVFLLYIAETFGERAIRITPNEKMNEDILMPSPPPNLVLRKYASTHSNIKPAIVNITAYDNEYFVCCEDRYTPNIKNMNQEINGPAYMIRGSEMP